MSDTADASSEFVVDAVLATEFERRGIHLHPGDRVKLQLVPPVTDDAADEAWSAYAGSAESGDPHLAERAKEIVRTELGR
jgi:hypothetical protein